MRNFFVMLMLGGLSLMTGCVNYYVVESNYKTADLKEQVSQVTRSVRAPDLSQLRTVAVKAPDVCISESQSEKTGASQGDAEVMKVQCGVEMSQIESALVKQGFEVISWKILDNAMKVADAQTATHLGAAKSLGADLLLQVNSMERSRSIIGTNARWDRLYKKANAYGEVKGDAAVSKVVATELNKKISQKEEENKPAGRLSATLNANAVDVSNGQAFWFYDWNNIDDQDNQERTVEALVRCQGKACFYAEPKEESLLRKIMNLLFAKQTLVTGDSQAITSAARARDTERARHEELIKEAIDDMVAHFAAIPKK